MEKHFTCSWCTTDTNRNIIDMFPHTYKTQKRSLTYPRKRKIEIRSSDISFLNSTHVETVVLVTRV